MRTFFSNIKAAIQVAHQGEEAQDGFEYLLVSGAVVVIIIGAIVTAMQTNAIGDFVDAVMAAITAAL